QDITGLGLVDHRQEGQCARVGRIALGPLEPALAEVLGLERVDHRDRDPAPLERGGKVEVIVAAGLQDRAGDLALAGEPIIEVPPARAVRPEAQPPLSGPPFAVVTDRRDVLALADVDADGLHASSSHAIIRPRGARLFRPTLADAHSPVGVIAPPQGPDHRSRTEARGPNT